jgi:transcriptional regulator with XRE-family HTH domain
MRSMSPIGSYLRELRERHGLQIREVQGATHGQVPEGWLASVELGRIARPAADRLALLAEVYGVPSAELLIRAGYLRPGEQLPEAGESDQPSRVQLAAHSPGLAEFVYGEHGSALRVTWGEVRTLLGYRWMGGAESKGAPEWRRLLLHAREWAGTDMLGAAYYPEDWPLGLIDEDIELMKRARCNVMRIGEFAWSRMEPQEGQYDFDWLHLVVDKLGAAGIATGMHTVGGPLRR